LSFLEIAILEKILWLSAVEKSRIVGVRYFRRLPKWKVLKILWRQCSPHVRIMSVVKTW